MVGFFFIGISNTNQHKYIHIRKHSYIKPLGDIKMLYKKCPSCTEIKPTSEFHKVKSSTDGFSTYCGHCKREHNKAIREQPAYNSFQSSKQRCNQPGYENYHRYGGRGIKYRLGDTYEQFWRLMGKEYERCARRWPNQKLTLERIDNDGHYEIDNCTFVPVEMQALNRSTNVHLTYKGETHTLSEWADIIGMHHRTLEARVRRGWTVEECLSIEPLGLGEKLYPNGN